MDERIEVQTPEEAVGQRIDAFLSGRLDMTRSRIQQLCEDGRLLVNGTPVAKNYKLRRNDAVELRVPPPQTMELIAQDIPLQIAYEDADLIVVDKPRGMVVHPAAGNEDGTLVNALLYHCGEEFRGIGGVARPGIVHRIDKDTSGLLVVAKSEVAHQKLSEMMKEHSVTRRYRAVVHGRVKTDSGTVDAPIGRHPTDRKKMAVTERHSRQAVTHYQVLEHLDGFSYLELELETGRTHQIRVHMAYLGHPVAGDPVYGPKRYITALNGQCLHAATLGFPHPVTGMPIELESPLPDYFTSFLAKHRKG
ncbi:RluA family pseudouridine synthase [Ruminococcaceae bacterium OttesenSCG-928-L11]|nr:RluA family pseudouridine synthase [Ruminococcaceae bacterium OttesenSCG-928-L11]